MSVIKQKELDILNTKLNVFLSIKNKQIAEDFNSIAFIKVFTVDDEYSLIEESNFTGCSESEVLADDFAIVDDDGNDIDTISIIKEFILENDKDSVFGDPRYERYVCIGLNLCHEYLNVYGINIPNN